MLDPAELYRIEPDLPELSEPVLVVVLDGFVDAGAAARLAVESLLAGGSGHLVARFDVDQLVDYRSRRPPLRFESDRWTSYSAPELDVVALTDTGAPPSCCCPARSRTRSGSGSRRPSSSSSGASGSGWWST